MQEIDTAFPVGGGLYFSEQDGIYQTSSFISSSTDLVYEKVYCNAMEILRGNNNAIRLLRVGKLDLSFPQGESVYDSSIS